MSEPIDYSLVHDPLVVFDSWQAEWRASGAAQPEAMTLATVSESGAPRARTVLYRGRVDRSVHFFTNYESNKGRDLAANPVACLLFHFASLERQVTIAGAVQKLTRAESETYFASRPRASQLGAWASAQSHPVESRRDLLERYRTMEARFSDGEVPCPPHWGGFSVLAERIELWQGMPGRLHDRAEFLWGEDGYGMTLLCP